jgi:hypothetical protein
MILERSTSQSRLIFSRTPTFISRPFPPQRYNRQINSREHREAAHNAMKLLLPLLFTLAVAAQTSDAPQYTPDGHLLRPANYREWIYLSSGLGMTYGPAATADHGNPKFENVFVSRTAYNSFRETGRWPDNTVLILEIRRAAEKGSINTAGRYQSEIISVEAAVKDEHRFPQKWAYFSFGQADKGTMFPANSACNSCHGQKAAVENTFVQFYPTLLEIATRKGTLNRSYSETATQHP